MTNAPETVLYRLLDSLPTHQRPEQILAMTALTPAVAQAEGDQVSRAVLAMGLNLLLLDDLLQRSPNGRAYMQDIESAGRRLVFDHGALRTVDLDGMGELPAGRAAVTRVLEPLGYGLAAVYPLDRLKMTGRAYAHLDLPEDLPQFFVSELHPKRFSPEFQAAAVRVTASSRDPLSAADMGLLANLGARGGLPLAEAIALMPGLVACFSRRHAPPRLADYEQLRAESAEMAWIATEGNAFNHATDRVANLDALVASQRDLGRPLKAAIEVSRSGRVRQTAFRADPVARAFVNEDGSIVVRDTPGSFFEFIQRELVIDSRTGVARLDLGFDSGNAQGIFKMTEAA